MATVLELTEPYGNVLLAPRHGRDVCPRCLDLLGGPGLCHGCSQVHDELAVVMPISLSVAGEQLHHVLAGYKRDAQRWTQLLVNQLAAVLWRHLAAHESCLARAARVPGFSIVTTVPSADPRRADGHPLQTIVSGLVGPTRRRHRALLEATGAPVTPHVFSDERFRATTALDGEPVLLIDDTWTTGANAQSAAAALRHAGAGPVAAVVIGRHLNRHWGANDAQLNGLPKPFDWDRCVHCQLPETS